MGLLASHLFLKNYGVWPSPTETLVNIPQTGIWEVILKDAGDYYFEVQSFGLRMRYTEALACYFTQIEFVVIAR